MKKILLLGLAISLAGFFGGCKSDQDNRPYSSISTADIQGNIDDGNPVGYANFENALTDTVYTLDKIPVKGK